MEIVLADLAMVAGNLLLGQRKMVWKDCKEPEQEIIRIIEMNDKIDIIDIIENLK